MLRNKIIRIILKLQGHNLFTYYDEYCAKQYLPMEKLKEIQVGRLKEMLLYSYNNVPYYTRILGEVKVVVDGKVNLDNFSKIPVLTKDIVREHFDELKCKDLDKRKWYLNTSGGSTGEPVKVIQDNISWDSGMASKWFFSTFAGKYPGDKEVKLWGSERDILKGSIGFKAKLKNLVFNRILLNSFKMSGDDMRQYVEIINKSKPTLIEAYVQSVYELARFIKSNEITVYSPQSVLTSAGTLYSGQQKLIEEVFRVKVYNRYGSREVGDVACSCEEDEGLHVNVLTHHVEILDDKMQPCKAAEIGQMYVTILNNYSMPLIRYQIGDIAVPAKNEQCSCGRGLPLIGKVVGRVGSMIKTKKGIFDSTALTTSFYYFESIKEYQVVQKRMDYIIVNIVPTDRVLWKHERDSVEEKLKKILGDEVVFDFQVVNKIEPSKSGKYLYIMSEVE